MKRSEGGTFLLSKVIFAFWHGTFKFTIRRQGCLLKVEQSFFLAAIPWVATAKNTSTFIMCRPIVQWCSHITNPMQILGSCQSRCALSIECCRTGMVHMVKAAPSSQLWLHHISTPRPTLSSKCPFIMERDPRRTLSLRLYCQSFSKRHHFNGKSLNWSRWRISLHRLLRSDRASDAQVTFRSNIDGPYWHAFMAFFFFPDSSQWGPVSQVNSWKLLHIIHHSLVPPAASFYSQNKQIRWLTVSCPPWGTCTPLWRIKSLDTKAASLWPKMTTFFGGVGGGGTFQCDTAAAAVH